MKKSLFVSSLLSLLFVLGACGGQKNVPLNSDDYQFARDETRMIESARDLGGKCAAREIIKERCRRAAWEGLAYPPTDTGRYFGECQDAFDSEKLFIGKKAYENNHWEWIDKMERAVMRSATEDARKGCPFYPPAYPRFLEVASEAYNIAKWKREYRDIDWEQIKEREIARCRTDARSGYRFVSHYPRFYEECLAAYEEALPQEHIWKHKRWMNRNRN
jgi:hypothetical protein